MYCTFSDSPVPHFCPSCLIPQLLTSSVVLYKKTGTEYFGNFKFPKMNTAALFYRYNISLQFYADQDACAVVNGFVHFCQVAVFSWLLMEAVHLFSMFQPLINEDNTSSLMYYLALGWGEYEYVQFIDTRVGWVADCKTMYTDYLAPGWGEYGSHFLQVQ